MGRKGKSHGNKLEGEVDDDVCAGAESVQERQLERLKRALVDKGCPESDSGQATQSIFDAIRAFANSGTERPLINPRKMGQLALALQRCREYLQELDSHSVLLLTAYSSSALLRTFDMQLVERVLGEISLLEKAATTAKESGNQQSTPPSNIKMFSDCALTWHQFVGNWPSLTTNAYSDSGNEPTHPLYHCVVDLSVSCGVGKSEVSPAVYKWGVKLARYLHECGLDSRKPRWGGRGLLSQARVMSWEMARRKQGDAKRRRRDSSSGGGKN